MNQVITKAGITLKQNDHGETTQIQSARAALIFHGVIQEQELTNFIMKMTDDGMTITFTVENIHNVLDIKEERPGIYKEAMAKLAHHLAHLADRMVYPALETTDPDRFMNGRSISNSETAFAIGIVKLPKERTTEESEESED